MRGTPLLLALLSLPALCVAYAQDVAEAPAELRNPNPLSGLALESLEATRSLPLFTPSRTAPSVEEPVAEVEPEPVEEVVEPEQGPPPLQLVGIVMTGESGTALLLDPGSNEVHRLATGEEYEGWSVKIVDSRSVELRSGDRVQGLKMFETFTSPPPMMEGELPAEDYPHDMMPEEVPMETYSEEAPPEETGTVEGEPLPPVQFDPDVGNSGIPEEGEPPPEDLPQD